MLKPTVPKEFLDELKLVRSGLHINWDQKNSKFFISHEHEYTKQRRIILYCETKEGNFRMPDMRDILHLRKFVDWIKIDQYPDVNDMFKAMVKEQRLAQEAKKKNRNNWIDDFIKDNKKGIRQAVRDLWENGYRPYVSNKKDPKIFVETKGYKQSDGGLLVPKFVKGE